MPTYGYHCQQCKHTLEVMQSITAEPLRSCPQCHQDSLIRGPGGGLGLHFKGSGFYITDYKNSSQPSECKAADKNGCCPCKAS